MPKSKTPTKEECMLLNLSICSSPSEEDVTINKKSFEAYHKHPELTYRRFKARSGNNQDRSTFKYGAAKPKTEITKATLHSSKSGHRDTTSAQRARRHDFYRIINDANKSSHYKNTKQDSLQSSADEISDMLKRSISITLPNKLNRYSASTEIIHPSSSTSSTQSDFRVRNFTASNDKTPFFSQKPDHNMTRQPAPLREAGNSTKQFSNHSHKKVSAYKSTEKQHIIDRNANKILKNRSEDDSVRLLDFIKQTRNSVEHSERAKERKTRHKEYIISQVSRLKRKSHSLT